jgi:hypothetical protein
MKSGERQIISQSHAARLRGVSRQRISELVLNGRFTVPTDPKGHLINGTVYLDEIINFEEGSAGRPRKSGIDWFAVGESVLWNLKPRNGYGYILPIVGKIVKSSNKRIQLAFTGGDGAKHVAWANREDCKLLNQLATGDDKVQVKEPVRELGNGRYVYINDPEQKILTRKTEF